MIIGFGVAGSGGLSGPGDKRRGAKPAEVAMGAYSFVLPAAASRKRRWFAFREPDAYLTQTDRRSRNTPAPRRDRPRAGPSRRTKPQISQISQIRKTCSASVSKSAQSADSVVHNRGALSGYGLVGQFEHLKRLPMKLAASRVDASLLFCEYCAFCASCAAVPSFDLGSCNDVLNWSVQMYMTKPCRLIRAAFYERGAASTAGAPNGFLRAYSAFKERSSAVGIVQKPYYAALVRPGPFDAPAFMSPGDVIYRKPSIKAQKNTRAGSGSGGRPPPEKPTGTDPDHVAPRVPPSECHRPGRVRRVASVEASIDIIRSTASSTTRVIVAF
jgi:hypothetical protein